MNKIKEIIVVEGRDDTQRIKWAVGADTIETNGSAINKETIALIKHAQEKRGVIVFTDPDFAGEQIRKIISSEVPGVKHAFLSQDESRPKHKGSLGIEHASKKSIIEALNHVYEESKNHLKSSTDITKAFLIKNQLVGTDNASIRRKKLGEILRIGYTNGKQLLKRLQAFDITRKEVEAALNQIDNESTD